jgi:uncharacterized protein (TIGR02452 family)
MTTEKRNTLQKIAKENKYIVKKILSYNSHPYNFNSKIIFFKDFTTNFAKSLSRFFNHDGTIKLVPLSTTECAKLANKFGFDNINLLNFANARYIGGGYLNGARAQEEDLCRKIPMLFAALQQNKLNYPIYNKVLLIRNLEILRDKHNKIITNSNYIKVNVVTAAAPNRYSNNSYDRNFSEKKWKHMFRAILTVAGHKRRTQNSNKTTIILGAIGCGAFGNDPSFVAKKMLEVLNEGYKFLFDKVFIAIPDANSSNYRAFANIF